MFVTKLAFSILWNSRSWTLVINGGLKLYKQEKGTTYTEGLNHVDIESFTFM